MLPIAPVSDRLLDEANPGRCREPEPATSRLAGRSLADLRQQAERTARRACYRDLHTAHAALDQGELGGEAAGELRAIRNLAEYKRREQRG